MNSKIEGLELGADDYVAKPFDMAELKIRVKNLIEQRKKLREKFTRQIDVNPEDIAVSSIDEQFVRRLLTVFEEHLSEPDYHTDHFAREVGMSRMHLNRKLQALTNQSTHAFIRSLRLKRAAKLLKSSWGSVSEIAYTVGFNEPSKFAKAFKKQYGKSPTEFSSDSPS